MFDGENAPHGEMFGGDNIIYSDPLDLRYMVDANVVLTDIKRKSRLCQN